MRAATKITAHLGFPVTQPSTEWTIVLLNRMPPEYQDDDGCAAHEAQRIYVCRNKEPWETLETLLHELFHAEFPDLAEESVSRAARHFRDVLRKLKIVKLAPLRRR